MNKLKKISSIITLLVFLFGQVLNTPVMAAPETPGTPSTPSGPENTPTTVDGPSTPETPQGPSGPNTEPSSTPEPSSEPDPSSAPASAAPSASPSESPSSSPSPSTSPEQAAASSEPSSTPSPTPLPSGDQTGAQDSSGQNGGASIDTGDATNQALLATNQNTNLALAPGESVGVSNTGPSAEIINSDNGSGSNNNGSLSVASNTSTLQDNSAQVANNLSQTTITGDNTANKNTGGDVEIKTGDANTTGTIINSVNTNISGVAVAEFNVEDDHVGDIVLDFAAGCISNCDLGSVKVANTGNGADSTNTGTVNIDEKNETFQNNDAAIENNLTLVADSGNNEANQNTGGNVSIETGDANIAATVVNFANNNIAGNVFVNTVNILGSLVGDIILPQEYIDAVVAACAANGCGGSDVSAANSGNGADSTNDINIDQTANNNTYQQNDANIENNLIIDATTSNNSASANTNGDNQIETGDVNVNAQVLNIANSNVSGGVWWIVLINEGGNWIGKIVGSPDGSHLAGSSGTEFIVTESGEIIATNSGNGAGSNNTTDISQNQTNTTTQNNTIDLANNINLSANTGGNQANKNTGGDSQISTGDVDIMANILQFVNNNFDSDSPVIITLVNVFEGKGWIGNFITPDGEKENVATSTNPSPSPTVVAQGNTQDNAAADDQGDADDDGDTTTSTTTKKAKKTKQASPSPVAVATNNSDTPSSPAGSVNASIGSSLSQVAGVKIGPSVEVPEGAVVGNNKIKVNLAWLVLVLPLLGLIALSRLRVAYYTRQIKNKLASKRAEGVLLGSLIAVCIYFLNKVS